MGGEEGERVHDGCHMMSLFAVTCHMMIHMMMCHVNACVLCPLLPIRQAAAKRNSITSTGGGNGHITRQLSTKLSYKSEI